MGLNPRLVLFPVFGMFALILLVQFALMQTRGAALKKHGASMDELCTDARADQIFTGIEKVGENFIVLFEVPVLFYTVSILIYITGMVDSFYIGCGWAYVALRAVHSLIHITYNRVTHRFLAFLCSNLILWAMWFRLGYQLLSGSYPQ